MAFARRAGEGSAREEVKASARARGSRGDDVREKERLEQDVGGEKFFQKKSARYSRSRNLPSAESLLLGDLPQSGAGASRFRVHPCTVTTKAVTRMAYDAASETFAYRPTAHDVIVATKCRALCAKLSTGS
jgi:hypothetical protein